MTPHRDAFVDVKGEGADDHLVCMVLFARVLKFKSRANYLLAGYSLSLLCSKIIGLLAS